MDRPPGLVFNTADVRRGLRRDRSVPQSVDPQQVIAEQQQRIAQLEDTVRSLQGIITGRTAPTENGRTHPHVR